MLASNSDIQAWLPDDKIVVNDAMALKPNIEAQRLIRGQLAGDFLPLTLAGWDEPGNTPEIIRGIAGRLCAAYIYSKIFSEETTTPSTYAQEKYNEAIGMLADIKSGILTVTDADGNAIDNSGTVLSFFPDGTTSPMFTIDQTFA